MRSEKNQFDLAHATTLTAGERVRLLNRAEEFLDEMSRYFDERYLHVDVEELPQQLRGKRQYRFKALLVTNRGRYYADAEGYGGDHAAKNVLDTLYTQIRSRLGRLEETAAIA